VEVTSSIDFISVAPFWRQGEGMNDLLMICKAPEKLYQRSGLANIVDIK
jgi:hypothetical protein